MSRLFGIIGYPLSHSFSPAYFTKKFEARYIDATYKPFSLTNISEYEDLVRSHPALAGLNVTIPYKKAVIPYLHELDNTATEIGAVNCISFKNGRSKGFNTDIIGFKNSLLPLLHPHHTRALILGTGGASLAVAFALKQLGITFNKVSRNKTKEGFTYEEITPQIIDQYKLIINTTPLGTYPGIEDAPHIPYKYIGKEHLLYDLIYNPEVTKFLALGKANGAMIKNGLEMLHLQAEASWEIWQ